MLSCPIFLSSVLRDDQRKNNLVIRSISLEIAEKAVEALNYTCHLNLIEKINDFVIKIIFTNQCKFRISQYLFSYVDDFLYLSITILNFIIFLKEEDEEKNF